MENCPFQAEVSLFPSLFSPPRNKQLQCLLSLAANLKYHGLITSPRALSHAPTRQEPCEAKSSETYLKCSLTSEICMI